MKDFTIIIIILFGVVYSAKHPTMFPPSLDYIMSLILFSFNWDSTMVKAQSTSTLDDFMSLEAASLNVADR